MVTIAKLNHQRKLAGMPLFRFDLLQLQPEDVQDLRDAYAAMYEISDIAIGDNRGYAAIARGHGYDQGLCHNDNRIFLTWHRAYIYAFEKALNTALQWKRGDYELELTLPYWDWTQFRTATHASNGLPKILNDATYENEDGTVVDNPLAKAKSLFRTISQGLTGDDAFTHRYPTQFRSSVPLLRDEVDRYLTNPSFSLFTSDLDFGAHGAVHVLVGGVDPSSPLPESNGDMWSITSASFDPIFWLHHAMVDKIWYDWQVLHPGVSLPDHVLETPVYGGRPGGFYVDAEASLRYIYTSDSVESAIASSGTIDEPSPGMEAAAADAGERNREVPLGEVVGGFARAQLDFLRLRPPKESFEIRAYIDNPTCDAKTGYDDPSYAGRMILFGHGRCHGAPGHCDPEQAKRDAYDIRPKHPLRYEHTSYCLDITRGLRRYIGRKKTVKDVKLYLVFADGTGRGVAPAVVRYEGCSLRTFA
ncbi:MAG: tyrosinase family protein [Alphaproteobacteria bacterium]